MKTKNMNSGEAGLVLEQIRCILERYKSISLADIKDLTGEISEYTDNLIVWYIEDLPRIRICRVGETEAIRYIYQVTRYLAMYTILNFRKITR